MAEKEGERSSNDTMTTKQEYTPVMKVGVKEDRQSEDLVEDLSIVVTRRASIARILIKHSLSWARYSLARLPIRMTLSNLGVMTVVLAIILPRSVTYMLLYPIFRLVFGNLYPAYASYKAVRTKNVKEYVKWMMYWIVFALFTCAETFTDVFFSFWFPFYYEIKTILVFWLLSPATKGSSILYRRFVHPALIRREAEIDEALARATEQGYTAVLHLGTKGVNYATTVLMQTAIKGGGGLVQHLRKSYSLSDLTGEKEDENRNTPDTHDETDMEVEPRRREHVGRRGYSPRRTQSSSNRVEMYFSEVDVDVRQPRPREPIASLTNIRSSDDISSGYSSGEALQSHRTTQGDSLVRTASVGARTRAKPRSATKKTPEDAGEDSDYIDFPSSKNISFPSPLNLVTPDQALELLLLLSQNSNVNEHIKFDRGVPVIGNDDLNNTSQLGPRTDQGICETKKFDTNAVDCTSSTNIQKVEDMATKSVLDNKLDDTIILSIDTRVEEAKIENIKGGEVSTNTTDVSAIEQVLPSSSTRSVKEVDRTEITDELCQNKFDELKQLLSDAHKAVNSIVHSQEKLKHIDGDLAEILEKKDTESTRTSKAKLDDDLKERNTDNEEGTSKIDVPEVSNDVVESNDKTDSSENIDKAAASDTCVTPNVSRSNSDSISRAGKYNKKPAPKAPLTESSENLDDTESQNALKATLVIKTGTLKTFSNTTATKDVFFAHDPETGKSKGKKSKRQRTKEGLSKLLTIPKNIFHSAFSKEHKESGKTEDASSVTSEISDSASRSNSIASQDVFIELSPKLSNQNMTPENISQEASNINEDESPNTNTEHNSSGVNPNDTDNKDVENINDSTTEQQQDVRTDNENLREVAKDSQNTVTVLESEIREMSQSPKPPKRIVSDIY